MELLARIEHWSHLAPDRVAHVSGGQTLTYRELSRRSDLLAAWLLSQLPDDDSPVAVLGHKEPEMLVAFLGALKAGHSYIPIDNSLPARRIEAIIQTANAAMLLTPEKVRELLLAPIDLNGFVAHHPTPDTPWYIIFTSGSSGDPKGVVITRGCLESFIEWTLAEPRKVPAGSKIEAVAWYDNSPNNKYNPDPTKEVHWGEQTFEEMMIGFFNYTVPVDAPLPPANAKPHASPAGF